jgi:hypothetical protein
MAKEIILYNLKDSVSDAEYLQYCQEKKGPLIKSLPSCIDFTLVRITASQRGDSPYAYVGIVDVTSLEDWKRDASSEAFQGFLKEWIPMVKDFHILMGNEIYGA